MKNFKINNNITKLLARTAMIVLMAPMTVGCGKKDAYLTEKLEMLSQVPATEDGQECLVDEYIKSYLSKEDTSMQELEIALQTAYISKDKDGVNECLAKILTAELKAIIAEGLGVKEGELENFRVIGVQEEPGLLDAEVDHLDVYAVTFDYQGNNYTLEAANGMAQNICFNIRAAMKGQVDLSTDSSTSFEIVYQKAKEFMAATGKTNDKASIIKLTPAYCDKERLFGGSELVCNGSFTISNNKQRTRVLTNKRINN